jgi:GST-like protein
MLKFYYSPAPNPAKVALFLEESGLPYEMVPVDTRRGDQFKPDFLVLNPNAKVPLIVDGDVRVFDSNAILLYLAEQTGQFLPKDPKARGDLLSWLFFIATGIGPYSGQAVHFRHHAPKGIDILDAQVAGNPYLLGAEYTIVDMAAWGWARAVPFVLGEDAWTTLPNLKRWFDSVNARPAAVRAEALKNRHAFKAELDDEARRNLFRHVKRA